MNERFRKKLKITLRMSACNIRAVNPCVLVLRGGRQEEKRIWENIQTGQMEMTMGYCVAILKILELVRDLSWTES